MAGRVLVADDHEPNRRLLQARLESERFDVVLAEDGIEAVEAAIAHLPDLILMDIMMPRMDGYEATRAIKADPRTRHIPVVMVTALSQQADRVRGLQAGADDFLTKPIDDVILFARVRSLLRLKQATDELHSRRRTESERGAITLPDEDPETDVSNGARILVLTDPAGLEERPADRLSSAHHVRVETDVRQALTQLRGTWDLLMLDLRAETFDGMALAASLKAHRETRRLPILALVDGRDRERLVRALDLGVNDVVAAPPDSQELDTRVRALVRRKRYADHLRASLDRSADAAVDLLTGLYDQGALETRLSALVERARTDGAPLSVVVANLDHVEPINETYGHEVADRLVRELASRLSTAAGESDVVGRCGGGELAVIMPGADTDAARSLAERIRRLVGDEPMRVSRELSIAVTASLGVSRLEPDDDGARVMRRAVQALDAAKRRGRNRVIVARLKRPDEAA